MRFDIHNERAFGLFSGRQTSPIWPPDKTIWFASGRETVISLLKSMKVENRTVLLPAYVPEGIYAPFDRSGWKIHFYRLNRYLDPVEDNLTSLLPSSRHGLALMIHYYGLHKPIERFARLCREYDVTVIEDMAHALPDPGKTYQSPADFSLYSLTKLFGVPDGGAMVRNSSSYNITWLKYSPGAPRKRYLIEQLSQLSVNTMSRLLPLPRLSRLGRSLAGRIFDAYTTLMDYFEKPRRMSPLSKFLMLHTDIKSHYLRRCKYRNLYWQNLDRNKFEFFPGINKTPFGGFGFPVLVDNRANLVSHLAKKGISGMILEDRWNFLPENELSRHADSIGSISRHFLFPTSPYLRDSEVEYVIDVANGWNPGVIRITEPGNTVLKQ